LVDWLVGGDKQATTELLCGGLGSKWRQLPARTLLYGPNTRHVLPRGGCPSVYTVHGSSAPLVQWFHTCSTLKATGRTGMVARSLYTSWIRFYLKRWRGESLYRFLPLSFQQQQKPMHLANVSHGSKNAMRHHVLFWSLREGSSRSHKAPIYQCT
jgi:hypothetical protein